MTIRTIVVDDEKLAIQGLMHRLEKFPDVEVIETCANGREALESLKKHSADLVISDIQMPELSGLELLSAAREIDPEMLFIMITSSGRSNIAGSRFAAGKLNSTRSPGCIVLSPTVTSLLTRRAIVTGE